VRGGGSQGHGAAVVQLPLRKNKQGKTMYPAVRESFMLDVSASDSVEDLSALLRAPVEEETAAERYQAQCKRNNIAPLNSVGKLLATCVNSTPPHQQRISQERRWGVAVCGGTQRRVSSGLRRRYTGWGV